MLNYLNSLQQQKRNVDVTVDNGFRQGVIHVRDGVILSAHSGILHGHGAILTLAQMDDPSLEEREETAIVQKNVYISLKQIEHFLQKQNPKSQSDTICDEEDLLNNAKQLFFQFRYKQAGEILVQILRYNRFFYPAWLWQSRILTRQDYIGKALDEAYRWGNHDQDIWRESRKIRPQLDGSSARAKRCFFCWSILSKGNHCTHCLAYLTITSQPQSKNLKSDEIKYALVMFEQAMRIDTRNPRIAYSLAIGYFNLKEYQRALTFLRLAVKVSSQTALTSFYRKSLSLLVTIARTQSYASKPATSKKGVSSSGDTTILVVEDSKTSRKVLSMLFGRLGYKVLEAATGGEAVACCKDNQPNLVLLDIMLPDTNGHALLPKLRDYDHIKDVPVIMLTGRHDSHDRIQGMNAGANEYLTKPFNPEKLINLVQRYLNPDGKSNGKPEAKKVVQTTSSPTPEKAVPQAKSQVARQPVQPAKTVVKTAPKPHAQQQARPQPQAAKPTAKNGQKSIFVIEDSQTTRKVISLVLGRKGFNIYEAATGREALELSTKIEPDLILLDVMLPDMTGYNILPQLKKLPHYENLPVIMLTGKRTPTDRMKGMLAGTNEYLTKPFNPEKLLSVINGYI